MFVIYVLTYLICKIYVNDKGIELNKLCIFVWNMIYDDRLYGIHLIGTYNAHLTVQCTMYIQCLYNRLY